MSRTTLAALAAGLLLGLALAAAPPAPRAEVPPYRGLDANLYMAASAEYRAACYQAFALAERLVAERLKARPAGSSRKPAVVMDLDETVLDNGGFQASQLRGNFAYDQARWDEWERTGGPSLRLIPGAKEFIAAAERAGVTVCHISNRNEKSRAETKAALERLGVPVHSEIELQLATDTSDKTERRARVAEAFDIVLLVGDNLRDFDERFRSPKAEPAAAIAARKAAVDATRDAFGTRWVILPNPAYGEWTKPLGRGLADLDHLTPGDTP